MNRASLLALLGIIFALYELVYVLQLHFFIYNIFRGAGLELEPLSWSLQPLQSMAILLSLVVVIAVVSKPSNFAGRLSLAYDLAIIVMGVVGISYMAIIFPEIATYGYINITLERIIFPALAIIALVDAARRTVGIVLPLIALAALLFALYQEDFNVRMVVNHFYYSGEGIFSTPLRVMVTYVFAFILFGSFLINLGVGRYITEFLLALFGPRVKGVAKLAVISSMFTGTVTGSSVANVLVTGTYTIPLSKKAGYPAHVAGAVEASSSTGGQIMPPVLGAAAFVMAEFLGRPYRDIVIAAFIPAILYFFSVYAFIDRISVKYGLTQVRKEDLPPLAPMMSKIYLLAPMVIIALLLLLGIEPQYAAVGSLGFLVLLVLIDMPGVSGSLRGVVVLVTTVLFIIASWASFTVGATLFFVGVSLVLFFMLLTAIMRGTLVESLLASFRDAAEATATVFIAAALAGIIQGSLTLTGLAATIGFQILDLAGGNLFLTAFFVMILSLVLGMGVPTTANYIITSTIGAPALALAIQSATGIPLDSARLVAHFFVFYFGILADVTPPVALASYAAAALAKADFWKTAFTATKLSLAGYLVPYLLLLNPNLLILTIQPGWEGALSFALGVASGIITIATLSAGIEGWLGGRLTNAERAILIIFAFLNLVQQPLVVSFLLVMITFAAYVILYDWSARRMARAS
ncbi:MAG: TRAP transporter fused permease subunit [Acidilobaceae archaeon]|nr:TRAP transporter fused permease subunit [Acidilobaceae archaeon]MDW7973773.1 TRAP transporter fused permease subunit [Sulfolobales archaeon]